MNEVIINTMVNKLDTLETRMDATHRVIQEITETVSNVKEQGDQLERVANITRHLLDKIADITFPVQEIQALKEELTTNNEWRANPKREKVVHVHTGGKLWLWTIGVGIAWLVFIVLWINSYNRQNDLEMQATLWEFAKVTANKEHLKVLQEMERNYVTDPKRVKQYVAAEKLQQQQILEAKENQVKAEKEAAAWKKVAGDTPKSDSRGKKFSKAKKLNK